MCLVQTVTLCLLVCRIGPKRLGASLLHCGMAAAK